MIHNRVLILEDEQLAGEKLHSYLLDLAPQLTIEWRRSITEGIDFLKHNSNIDLIVSDIELLDGSSFEIYEAVEPPCPIIFCTAFDTFYVNAFETKGISYLLKPYNKQQFKAAWDKFQSLFHANIQAAPSFDLNTLNEIKQLIQNSTNTTYKTTFSVKKNDGVFLLKKERIVYFQAQGDFALAFDDQGKKHIINSTLTDILTAVDPKDFFRINRSEIIQHRFIKKYEAFTKNRLSITTTVLPILLHTSNSRSSTFKKWLEN